MKIYDCLINRGGDTALCEIPKMGISEHELRVLRDVHGGEAITKVEQVGERDFNEDDEMKRLAAIYGQRRVEKVFGVQLENFEDWVNQRLEGKKSPRDSIAAFVRPEPPAVEAAPTVEAEPPVEEKPRGTLTLAHVKKPIENRVE